VTYHPAAVTSAELDRIEHELQIELPADYRQTMETYPFARDSFSVGMLMNDVDVLIGWNSGDKNLSIDGRNQSLTFRDYFKIGSDGGELSFFLKHTGSPNPVYCYDLESGNFEIIAQDIVEYVEHCAKIDAGTALLPNESNDMPGSVKWVSCVGILVLLSLFGYGVFRLARALLGLIFR
jgi:hypothetical protein